MSADKFSPSEILAALVAAAMVPLRQPEAGRRIAWLMKANGLTFRDLGRETGAAPSTIFRIVIGEQQLASQELIDGVAKLLWTTRDYLTGRTDDPCGRLESYLDYLLWPVAECCPAETPALRPEGLAEFMV